MTRLTIKSIWEELQRKKKQWEARLDNIDKAINGTAEAAYHMKDAFEKMEIAFDSMDKLMVKLNKKVDNLEEEVNRLKNKGIWSWLFK